VSAPRGIPTSRAYWELQAEKLMNRIFDPAELIDLGEGSPAARDGSTHQVAKRLRARRPQPEALPAAAPVPLAAAQPAPAPAAPEPAEPSRRAALATLLPHPQPVVLVAAFACSGLVTAGAGVVALSQWNRSQETLQQERNLLLVERLRSLGPGTAAPITPAAPILAAPVASGAVGLATGGEGGPALGVPSAGGTPAEAVSDLPPPPPQEPWIEQLGELPRPQRSAPLLRVPVSPKLAAATVETARPRRSAPPGPLPLLVGVVGSPGKLGSAIFQMGGSTSTVGVGESIGSSGWRLRSTDGDSVLIDHEGDVRRITIGSGG